MPCTSFAFRHAGAWLIHHLGNVPLDNEELMDMQREYLTSKTNNKCWWIIQNVYQKQALRKYFAFTKACIIPLLPRDVICFYNACFVKSIDHHSHNSTITEKLKIFQIRTIEQFRLGGTSREHILQILLKTDLIGWGCPRLCPVKSWILSRTDIPQPPWVTCSSLWLRSW